MESLERITAQQQAKPPAGTNRQAAAPPPGRPAATAPAPEAQDRPRYSKRIVDGREVFFLPTADGKEIPAVAVAVVRGESLEELAHRLNVHVQDIRDLNELPNLDPRVPLHGGQLLVPARLASVQ